MSRATYRCTSGHSTRRKAVHKGIKCPKCGLLASMVDPTPGRPPAPPELARVELHISPLASTIRWLGDKPAKRAAEILDRAAKRGDAKTRRA